MGVLAFRAIFGLAGVFLLLSPILRVVVLTEGPVSLARVAAEAQLAVGQGGWLDLAGGLGLLLLSALPARWLRLAGEPLRAALAGPGAGLLIEGSGPGRQHGDAAAALRDILFLAVVTALAAAPYVTSVGFHADDYGMLQAFVFSEDQSLPGVFQSLFGEHQDRSRPVHVLYSSILYTLFGLNPTGYHLANVLVLVLVCTFFYLALRALRQPRVVLVAVPLLFALLPHYSTDRVWIAAYQIPLSLLFYFVSLHADIRAVGAEGVRSLAWRALGGLGLVASLLAYEITLLLFLLNPLIAWRHARQLPVRRDRSQLRARVAASLLVNGCLIAAIAVFKTTISDRLGMGEGLVPHFGRQLYVLISPFHALSEYGLNLWKALHVNFVQYGIGIPYVVWQFVTDYAGPAQVVPAVAAGALSFGYLYALARRAESVLGDRTGWLRVLIGGLVVFAAGYGTFLLTPQIALTPTGHGNRVSMAAAIGVAIALIGVIGWLSGGARAGTARAALFAGLVGFFGASAVLINGTIASFWIKAGHEQRAALGSIRQAYPTLPGGTVLIVDGLCPYVGPGIVFDNFFDLGAALRIMYRDLSIQADVVTGRLRVTDAGLASSYYTVSKTYPYGESLILFDLARGTSQRLTDEQTARRHLEPRGARTPGSCPEGSEALGAPIL